MFKRFWTYLGKLGAPPLETPLVAPVPLAPITQEEFADHYAESRKEDQQLHKLNMRLVKSNNAYVTRNYGRGPVVEHDDSAIKPITEEELKKLKVLALTEEEMAQREVEQAVAVKLQLKKGAEFVPLLFQPEESEL